MAPYSAPKPMSWTRWIPPSSVSNQAKTTAAPNSPPKEAAAKSPARTLKAIRFAFEPGAATSGAPASRSPPFIPDLLSDVRSAHPNPRLVDSDLIPPVGGRGPHSGLPNKAIHTDLIWRPARPKPQVTRVIGVFDPHRQYLYSPEGGRRRRHGLLALSRSSSKGRSTSDSRSIPVATPRPWYVRPRPRSRAGPVCQPASRRSREPGSRRRPNPRARPRPRP